MNISSPFSSSLSTSWKSLLFSNYTKHNVSTKYHEIKYHGSEPVKNLQVAARVTEDFPSGGRKEEEEAMNGALDFPILSNAGLKRRRERRKRRGEVSTPRYFLSWIQCDPGGAVTWTRALLFSPEYGGNFSTREGNHRRTAAPTGGPHISLSLSLSLFLSLSRSLSPQQSCRFAVTLFA